MMTPTPVSTSLPDNITKTNIQHTSNAFDEVTFNMTGLTGSLRYMAPEVCLDGPYNHKADCYSFGVLAWQVMTKSTPYGDMDVEKFKEDVARRGKRMPVPGNWPEGLKEVVAKCWAQNIAERPNMKAIAKSLNDITHTLEETNTNSTIDCRCAIM